MKNIKKRLGYCALMAFVIVFSGCTVTDSPRPRPGVYAAATMGVPFLDVNSLGHHNYGSFLGENNGIVYTCRGGDIDLAHLRIAADNTYYLYKKISKHLKSGDTDFTYKLNTDPSVFVVHITYPPDFMSLPKSEQQKIIDEVSLELAQQFTWYMVSWHEILTWVGLKAFLVASQFHSAFAWEDSYSNLMGTIVGAKAIRRGGSFNHAMDAAIKEELIMLEPQPSSVAYHASDEMRDKWYSGYVDVKMLLRNLDMGLDDGHVSPALVPGICPAAQPMNYPVPALDTANRYGFTVDLRIKPNGFTSQECFRSIYSGGYHDLIIPAKHLPIIMNCIQQQAEEMGYIVMH
jgi:hypothetical protein